MSKVDKRISKDKVEAIQWACKEFHDRMENAEEERIYDIAMRTNLTEENVRKIWNDSI